MAISVSVSVSTCMYLSVHLELKGTPLPRASYLWGFQRVMHLLPIGLCLFNYLLQRNSDDHWRWTNATDWTELTRQRLLPTNRATRRHRARWSCPKRERSQRQIAPAPESMLHRYSEIYGICKIDRKGFPFRQNIPKHSIVTCYQSTIHVTPILLLQIIIIILDHQ